MQTIWAQPMTHAVPEQGIYQGNVRHRRFTTPLRAFSYPLFMTYIDLDRLDELSQHDIHTRPKFAALQFRRSDYWGDKNTLLKDSINQVLVDNGEAPADKIFGLLNLRCWGLYFSPINMYYCYRNNQCQTLVAEVSNTPWGESCCYVVDIEKPSINTKEMHVSPFQPRNMDYHWKISEPTNKLLLHIENHRQGKEFDATMTMKKTELNRENVKKILIQFPWMTLKVLTAIYWQAAKLLVRRARFYPHSGNQQGDKNASN